MEGSQEKNEYEVGGPTQEGEGRRRQQRGEKELRQNRKESSWGTNKEVLLRGG